ncbi:MAG: hypothetical protein H7336_12195 [Bacteriovorax sp.]|nr:hypothetical protein [Bacteriovorax sp.]
MKLMTALAFLVLSTSLFAATPYSFKCTTGSDGKCPITTANAHVMKVVKTDVYGGTESNYNLFLEVDSDATYMFVFNGKTMMAQAQNSTYLAVPTADGFVGMIVVDSAEQIPSFIESKL